MAEANGTYKIATLSDGREIKVDIEAMRVGHRKVREIKAIAEMKPLSDAHLAWVSKYTGMSIDSLLDLDQEDFKLIDKALGAAMQEISGPN